MSHDDPLMNAIDRGHLSSIISTLEGGADVNANGGLALKTAADRGNFESLLIRRAIHVEYDDNADVLTWVRIIKLLLDAGADIRNAKTMRNIEKLEIKIPQDTRKRYITRQVMKS